MRKLKVWFENKNKKSFVGTLEVTETGFRFTYSSKWLNDFYPIDPDMIFPVNEFTSLPDFFKDRVPPVSRHSTLEYASAWGLKKHDLDDIILVLTTLGKRGPSKFIFDEAA